MSIDLLMQHLQADLRFCLENPSEEARRSLLETLEDNYSVPIASEDSSRWWMLHLSNAVRLLAQHPTKLGYQSLIRGCRHYRSILHALFYIATGKTKFTVKKGFKPFCI